jgi:hypothetical protein
MYNVATEVGICHASAHKLIHDILQYRKVSSLWMPHPTRQQQRSAILPHSVGSAWTTPLQSRPAPSDFHFFPSLKRTFEGRRFTINEDVEEAVRTFVRTQNTDFYQQGFFKLVKRWDKCINVGGDYVEK